MEKIETIEEVISLLKQGEILFKLQENEATYFALRNENVIVKSTSSTYRLPLEQWQVLFRKEVFYLYDRIKDEGVSLEKDEEYYSWKHK